MRKLLLFAVLVAAACGRDAEPVLEPTAASLNPTTNTAIAYIDGVEYEYGCPDFPCPVQAIVAEHIAKGLFFWLPPGTFVKPTIYLTVLRTPVQLRPLKDPPIIDPPVVENPQNPYLTGPNEVLGRKIRPLNQLTCGDFGLLLNSPDGGDWDFVSGTIIYQYVTYDPILAAWVPTGDSSTTGMGAAAWAGLLAGTYTLYPPFAELAYKAIITAVLRRGTFTRTVTHTLLCHDGLPAAPPAPDLDGPELMQGVRVQPIRNLVCSDVDLDLISPDGGPWSFVSGERKLEFYGWDPVKRMFVKTGDVDNSSVSSSQWDELLDGTYDLDPLVFTGPYAAIFTITVNRGPFQYVVTHTVTCGGQDFLNQFVQPA